MKQTLNGARPTAQRLAASVREFTGTLQSHPFKRKRTSWVYELPTGQHSGRALNEFIVKNADLPIDVKHSGRALNEFIVKNADLPIDVENTDEFVNLARAQ